MGMSVCVYVGLRTSLACTWSDLQIFLMCGRGSVLLGQRCDTLRTSCFINDVMFARRSH